MGFIYRIHDNGFSITEFDEGESEDDEPAGPDPRSQPNPKRLKLWKDDPHCQYCGRILDFDESTVDHVIPLSAGGSNAIENLRLACHRCNGLKGSTPYDEFVKSGKAHEKPKKRKPVVSVEPMKQEAPKPGQYPREYDCDGWHIVEDSKCYIAERDGRRFKMRPKTLRLSGWLKSLDHPTIGPRYEVDERGLYVIPAGIAPWPRVQSVPSSEGDPFAT